MMHFEPITTANEQYVARVDPVDEEQYWVHYNAYWLGNSRTHPDINAKLIYVDGVEQPVGFIAYGQHYANEDLTQPVVGTYEIIHLVIGKPWQRRGYGRQATLLAMAMLRANPDCRTIVIAHNPANHGAQALYVSLGFAHVGHNYDGDPLLELK